MLERLIIAAIVGIAALLLPWRRRAREPYERCVRCEYIVRGITSGECPECGAKLAVTGVYGAGEPRYAKWLWIMAAWSALIAIPVSYFDARYYFVFCTTQQAPYIEGETGGPIHTLVLRSFPTFRWFSLPGQRVTAPLESVHLSTTSGNELHGHRRNREVPLSFSTNRTDSPEKHDHEPLTVELIAEVLKKGPGDPPPLRTAEAILSLIEASDPLKGSVSVAPRQPILAGLKGKTYALPCSNLPFSTPSMRPVVQWLAIITWAIGLFILYRRWQQRGITEWRPDAFEPDHPRKADTGGT